MPATQLCSLVLGELRFGVDARRVQEVLTGVPLTPVPRADPRVLGLLHRRSQVVTVIDLRRRLELSGTTAPDGLHHVLLPTDAAPVSLAVDAVDGVVDLTGVPRSAPPTTVPEHVRALLVAVHALPDSLLLELDVDRVIDLRSRATVQAVP